MHKLGVARVSIFLIVAVSLVPAAGRARGAAPAAGPSAGAAARPTAAALDALPMAFEPNVGQADARVRYLARGRGYTVFLTEESATLSLGGAEALRLSVEGARPNARLAAERELPGKSNYLSGADRSKWRRNVPTYAAVRYEGVYPGVDAVFYGDQSRLEYDFVVAPGADPSQIRVRFEGQRGIAVSESGELLLRLASGEVRQRRAVVYQHGAAGKREVEARYVLGAGGEVTFALGDYDRSLPLTIDPVLEYAHYFGGGESAEAAYGVAVDASGAAYVAGETTASDFPTTAGSFDPTAPGAVDAFVSKISPDGRTLVYSTYLGGAGEEFGYAVAVGAGGDAWVTGATRSADFPTSAGAFDATYNGSAPGDPPGVGDAFVARLSADGATLLYSTFLGGAGGDAGRAVAVAPGGGAVVAGEARDASFPTTPGAFDTTFNGEEGDPDAFVARFSADGALVYSTFVGGAQQDAATAIAVDAAGAAYVAGYTLTASGFPTTPGAYDTTYNNPAFGSDGFLAKVSPDGSALVYSTFLGGSDDDTCNSVAVDAAGAAYVAGRTESISDYPTTPGAFVTAGGASDAFVTKVSPDGASLAYSSRFGGSSLDGASALDVDEAGAVYVTGEAQSADFPTTPGAFDATRDGVDAFVAKLSTDGASLAYSTFLGGAFSEAGYAVAAGPGGSAFVAGETRSVDFPTTPGSVGPRFGGGRDAFVTRLAPDGGSLEYSAALSGTTSPGSAVLDEAAGVAVGPGGETYLAGSTRSPNFPATPGAPDGEASDPGFPTEAFVAKVSADGATLLYATFLGGALEDVGAGIAVDAAGSAYVTGWTASGDFPTTPGAFDTTFQETGVPAVDAFVAKLSADGSDLLYSTFLGGTSSDLATAIAVDAAGAAHVAGMTASADFPATPGAFQTSLAGATDAFVAKLSADGSALAYATYVGGGDRDEASGIALDAAGGVYVAGETASSDFPATPGAFDTTPGGAGFADAFALKLAEGGGSLVYATYLGGGARDGAGAVAADGDGAAYVTGATSSADFPTTPGASDTTLGGLSDAFVAKVAPDGGALEYSTYLGGAHEDASRAIAVDAAGLASLTGVTSSPDFPTTSGAFDRGLGEGGIAPVADAFVTVVAADGGALEYSTFLGGDGPDFGNALALGPDGALHVAGETRSTDFATTGFGGRDGVSAFVAKLRAEPFFGADTPGVYDAGTGAWFLRNESSAGPADLAFGFGPAGQFAPLSGDWDGDGVDTPGIYDLHTGVFFLKNSSGPGPADLVYQFGGGGFVPLPVVGDWDGDGIDTVGIFFTTGFFFLRNEHAPGPADLAVSFGPTATSHGIAGDWDGDGVDTVGVYVLATGAFFLRNSNTTGPADVAFTFGGGNGRAIAGDWDGDGVDTVGVYQSGGGVWFLRNENAPGPSDLVFGYGPPGAEPAPGDWDGQ